MFAIMTPRSDAHPSPLDRRRRDEEGGPLRRRGGGRRHVGTGEFRGLEFFHVNARTIVNRVPAASRMPFRLHDQRLPRLQPRLRLLLRPADPRLPRVRDRRRLRPQDRRQGQRRRTAAGRAGVAAVDGRVHRHGHQHRPVPAGRGQVPPDPGHRRRARRGGQPLLHPHQVHPDPARPRPAGRAAARGRASTPTCRSARSTRRSGASPSRARPLPAAGWRRSRRLNEAGIPCGVLVAPVLPGPLRQRRAAGRGGRGVRRPPAPCRSRRSPSTSGPASGSTTWAGWRARPDLVGDYERRFRRGAYQPDEERNRIEGVVREAALRCGVTGRDRYRGVRSRQTGHHPSPAADPTPAAYPEEGGEQLSLL